MTTPIQAQIEAARLSEENLHSIGHARYLVERATPDNPDVCFDYELVADLLSIIDRLTAAAEVGENGLLARIKELENGLHEYACTGTDQPCGCYELYMKDKNIAAATIERCAQVAESRMRNEPASIINSMCEEIAAGIRALKDKPPADPNIIYPGKDLTNVFPEET